MVGGHKLLSKYAEDDPQPGPEEPLGKPGNCPGPRALGGLALE